MITWRYEVWAIASDKSVISGTHSRWFTSKNKATDAALSLFKTVSPVPWRVVVQPRVYKVNGKVVKREIEQP